MLPRLYRCLLWTVIGVAVVSAGVAAHHSHSAPPQPSPSSVTESAPTPDQPSVRPEQNDDGPIVEPGKVRWHASFADAQAAAQRSGKPVLLFRMMGRLDHQFC